MERLLEDATRKFEKAFEDGKDIKITQYADTQQGAFTLSSLVEMDQHLLKDYHFQEMITDITKYLAPEYVEKADGEEKFFVLACGLLRGLVRECIAVYDPVERKQMIEEVYNWYRNKRKILLDYRIQKTKQVIEEKMKKIPRPKTPKREPLELQTVKKATLKDQYSYNARSLMRLGQVTSNEEKKRRVFIKNKLKQFSTRNLAKTNATRKVSEPPPVVEEPKKEGFTIREAWQEKQPASEIAFDTHVSVRSERPAHIQAAKEVATQPYKHYQKPTTAKEQQVMQHWLYHRAQEAEEELEENEFRDTVTMWSYNRARIEEEIHRRQESFRFSSQTGVRIHKLRSSDRKIPEDQLELQKIEIKQHEDHLLDSDDDLPDTVEEEPEDKIDGPKAYFLSPYAGNVEYKVVPLKDIHKAQQQNRPGFLSPHPEAQALYIDEAPGTSRPASRSSKSSLPPRPSTVPGDKRERIKKLTPIVHHVSQITSGSSELRKKQIEEVERIKLAFARKNIHVPLSTLHRSIVTPEDLPHQLCVQTLPKENQRLINDIIVTKKKKKKRKDKKKGKGKKAKKK